MMRLPHPQESRRGPDPVDRISLFAGILAILGGMEAMSWIRDSDPAASDLVVFGVGFAIPLGTWAIIQLIGRPFRRPKEPDEA